ncbi:hypothetical protein BpHYR1_025042, partial [Brachionus plicatilis]
MLRKEKTQETNDSGKSDCLFSLYRLLIKQIDAIGDAQFADLNTLFEREREGKRASTENSTLSAATRSRCERLPAEQRRTIRVHTPVTPLRLLNGDRAYLCSNSSWIYAIRSQTSIILSVQQKLEDILAIQNVIVQNQHDMYDKLKDIEFRLVSVESRVARPSQHAASTATAKSGLLQPSSSASFLPLWQSMRVKRGADSEEAEVAAAPKRARDDPEEGEVTAEEKEADD